LPESAVPACSEPPRRPRSWPARRRRCRAGWPAANKGRAQQAADAQAYEQQQQLAAQQAYAEQAAPQAAAASPAPTAAGTDIITQLKELGALKEQGILTDDEFAAQKARILGS
jgi:hypothetical protein